MKPWLDVFYITAEDKKPNFDSLIKSFFGSNKVIKNSSVKFVKKISENKCLCILTKSKEYIEIPKDTKICVCFEELNLDLSTNKDSKTEKIIKDVIFEYVDKASCISNEPLDKSKNKEIFAKIVNKFNSYFSYKNKLLVSEIKCDNHCLNIIDLVNEIFCETLISHLLINGNKCLDTMLLTNLLYSLGYYMKYTYSKYFHANWEMYVNIIAGFILNYEKSNDLKLLHKETKKFILENLFLSLNFR